MLFYDERRTGNAVPRRPTMSRGNAGLVGSPRANDSGVVFNRFVEAPDRPLSRRIDVQSAVNQRFSESPMRHDFAADQS